jgi:hypothetical protein
MKKILLIIISLSVLLSAQTNNGILQAKDSSYIMVGIGASSRYKMNLSMGYIGKDSDIGILVNIKFDPSSDITNELVYTDLSKNPFGDKNVTQDYKSSQWNVELMIRMYDYLYLNPIIGWGTDDYYNKLQDNTGILSNGGDYYYTPAYTDQYFVTGLGAMLKIGYVVALLELEVPLGNSENNILVGFNIGCMLGW